MKKLTDPRFLAQAAAIAAVYVVLTMVFSAISFGEIQVRISEALTALAYLTPVAIPGLFAGCFLANLLSGAILPDILFGSLATLAGALITWRMHRQSRYLAWVGPTAANALVIPFILRYGYGVNLPVPLMMLTVGVGELISCGVFGQLLLAALRKYKGTLFPEN